MSGAAVSYAKALETELNAALFPSIRSIFAGKAPHEREAREDGRLLDLSTDVPHQTLGTLLHLLERQDLVQAAVRQAMPSDHGWMLGVLPRQLAPIRDFRNASAHSEVSTANAIEPARRTILGIGCEGLLERLVRVRMRALGR